MKEVSGPDKAVLIVDDEAIICLALKQELKIALGSAYRYETALDGTRGLATIKELVAAHVKVVLIISDWLMPGMKGDEFLIEARRGNPDVRTIMVSGQCNEFEVGNIRSSGILDAFFKKPWDSGALLRTCRTFLLEEENGSAEKSDWTS
jgi:DNA-binding NtrC family response regulator